MEESRECWGEGEASPWGSSGGSWQAFTFSWLLALKVTYHCLRPPPPYLFLVSVQGAPEPRVILPLFHTAFLGAFSHPGCIYPQDMVRW